ncbi:hypothetical protein A2125_00065 [Candidatus Woesebacteria bacterium GWB1_43_5]|uniref:PDZ domain-containing protein n=1 Tax=Candidatus Woesebacteria bacterium GWB1_43_5 TaxID=1802474 RepID=A0A1F7WSP7_9BACT|nr:MAG: hypothetical protein A2125_00065 [Candidatus Woesebacteria bacterium GWB1_43_5]
MIISIISFLLVLSVLILIHEAGHFFAARRFGIWVEEFGLGLPPRAFGKKRGSTIYSLNWLPFGGFVRLHGESSEETISNPKVAFLNKSKKVRTLVIAAGVVMNLILGIVAFAVVYSFTGIPRDIGHVRILGSAEGSPAAAAGLKENDIVREVDGIKIVKNDEFIKLIDEQRGKETVLKIERDGKLAEVKVTPRVSPPEGEGALGVGITSSEIYYPPVWQRPFLGVYYGFGEAIFWGKAVLSGLGSMIRDLTGGHIPRDIAGPIGIFNITSEIASLGILPLINFAGILSVNLAVINILPFPALDGGRLVFVVFEAITRRRVTPRVEAAIHGVGMAVLLSLVLVISFFDIKRLAEFDRLPAFLMQFFK